MTAQRTAHLKLLNLINYIFFFIASNLKESTSSSHSILSASQLINVKFSSDLLVRKFQFELTNDSHHLLGVEVGKSLIYNKGSNAIFLYLTIKLKYIKAKNNESWLKPVGYTFTFCNQSSQVNDLKQFFYFLLFGVNFLN